MKNTNKTILIIILISLMVLASILWSFRMDIHERFYGTGVLPLYCVVELSEDNITVMTGGFVVVNWTAYNFCSATQNITLTNVTLSGNFCVGHGGWIVSFPSPFSIPSRQLVSGQLVGGNVSGSLTVANINATLWDTLKLDVICDQGEGFVEPPRLKCYVGGV